MEIGTHPNHTAALVGQPNHSDRLPPELKCVVVRYLANLQDCKSLSLVNKAWSDVILPIMWETFNTDLIASGQRKVYGLAGANSNIIKYVRKIDLSRRTSATTAEDQLPMLLAAIPRGQLRAFKGRRGVPASTLKLMLQIHTEIEELKLSASNFSELLESAWTAGCFSKLTDLDIYVSAFTRDGLRRIWTECTRLLHIRMFPSPNNRPTPLSDEVFALDAKSMDASIKSLEPDVPMKLISLYIWNIALPHTVDAMLYRINFLALQKLTIDECINSSALLGALGTKMTTGRTQLRKLRIVRLQEETTDDFIQSILLLLLAFQGLEQLHIHCYNCAKIAIEGILNHGETLKCLVIVNGSIYREDKDRCMGAADMQQIAAACPRLEHLCLNLYEIDPDKPEGDVLGPHPSISFEPTEFEGALSAIATLPSLRILRFTNAPDYRKAYDRRNRSRLFDWFTRELERGDQRHAFQARADGIMRYLGHRGSNIKVLAFAPAETLVKATSPDRNGHVWPYYFYNRGKRIDHKMAETAVAVPVADWKSDLGDCVSMRSLAGRK
jgi:hypothetical protein